MHVQNLETPNQAADGMCLQRTHPAAKLEEISTYTWTDDASQICITIPVPEPIPKEQVR